MGFGFKQPLVGEKRCVMTLITAAKETKQVYVASQMPEFNKCLNELIGIKSL